MHLVIVIPAYNEAQVIAGVIERLPVTIDRIGRITALVVDDGSEDETPMIAKQAGAQVVRHRVNLGVGAATTTGFAAARLLQADIIVTLDADGQHNPLEIPRLIDPIVHQKADIVIGSRLQNPAGMPIIKLAGNWIFNIATYLLSGIWTTDSQSGYRAYSAQAIELMELKTPGYEICSEMFVEIAKRKLRMIEYPIETIYTDYAKLKGQHPLNGVNILIKLILRGIGGPK